MKVHDLLNLVKLVVEPLQLLLQPLLVGDERIAPITYDFELFVSEIMVINILAHN